MTLPGAANSRGFPTQLVTRLAALVLVTELACGGSAFSGVDPVDPDPVGPDGSAGQAAAGAGVDAAAGSEAGVGGAAGGEGGRAAGGAPDVVGGQTSESGGAGGAPDCSDLQGITYAAHCYVDVTAVSVNQEDASAACQALARRAGRSAALLVLNSADEQSFIVERFLTETTDAWLALTCSSSEHPELLDCYCQECDDGQLLQKRAAWAWADGSSASFGWSGNNPDGGVRCSALAYNATTAIWGWVDRSCLSTTHQIQDLPVHSYRVICELP